jgi:hypothetical protein
MLFIPCRKRGNIAEFEKDYMSDQAIQWYTRNYFVYKLVNQAVRTEDIDTLYTDRFYIVDLCVCVAENCQLLHNGTSKYKINFRIGSIYN